jgi:hypothetical protein
MLHRLIYRSHVAKQVRLPDVEEINARAALRNSHLKLTGLLVYTPSHFLQILEGEREDIEQLFERLKLDPRHFGLRLLTVEPAERRLFADWHMELRLPTTELRPEALEAMDGAKALALLLALR